MSAAQRWSEQIKIYSEKHVSEQARGIGGTYREKTVASVYVFEGEYALREIEFYARRY